MKQFKNGVTRYNSADLALAFGYVDPLTKCTKCLHIRDDHHLSVTFKPGVHEGIEERGRCESFDRRTKSGYCKCECFTEPKKETTNV